MPERPGPALEERFLDHVVGPLVSDPMLWPILAVFVGHFVTGLSYALVLGLRDRKVAGLLALALAALLTFNGARTELRVRRRPGALCAILAVTWGLAIAVAGAAAHYHVL
jgi:hypothetical protein